MNNAPVVVDTNLTDILPRPVQDVTWKSNDPTQSLREVPTAVEEEAQKAIDSYWTSKRWKRILSQGLQFFALTLTAVAAIASVVFGALKNAGAMVSVFDSGAIASLCIGIAAALIGRDKAFGFSSGWTGYVLTATSMTKLLHEFRMDLVAFFAAADDPPRAEQRAGLIRRAKDFVSTIEGMVVQETKDWADAHRQLCPLTPTEDLVYRVASVERSHG
jgi:SMODS and SLOG-associating 2TM effector domain 2